ncbi:MAG TPA: multiheme c-type cytochrome, partial [Polyangiales bacterium]|nr:multiheme c-type cytochrome [Polyangiales bacterium]
ESVLGAFDGTTLDYMGVRARMQRTHEGAYEMQFTSATDRWSARVERTVGSHRYQQYLARDGDVFFRLPIAWDVVERRFLHMNGAFLTPDPPEPAPGASVGRSDYDRHVTRWNDNCVYCHNVHPTPGLDPDTGQFDTRVAELGVACEACHGPGAEHVKRNADPLRRYALHFTQAADPTITNPSRLTGERSAQVCGRCHGQRITGDIARFHEHGDSFVPGEDLAHYSKPLARDTALHGDTHAFAARFWNDGTARLTAYEYQGYLQSPCRKAKWFSCESCHAMHDAEGNPSGQLRSDIAGNQLCTQCHQPLAATSALAAHTHHAADSSGSRCVACHMPNLVYGLVSVHVSHRIEIPDPARDSAASRPDACTLCHVTRSRSWAAAGLGADHTRTADAAPESAERLFAGDPIERAVAADALGRAGARFAPDEAAGLLDLLDDAATHDHYPAVRSIAAHSAKALRARSAAAPSPPSSRVVLSPERRAQLRALAAQSAIEIGE